jgi:hypothetical protein
VVINLSIKPTERYSSWRSEKTLRHCLRAAETFSEEEILSATQRQLTWTHLKSLMYIKDPLERQVLLHTPFFYRMNMQIAVAPWVMIDV